MKNLTLIIFLTVHYSLFTIHSFSQPCLPEGITFTTQTQIDSFQINYPSCTEIEGGVQIGGNDITNLNGLTGVTSIGGGLSIGYQEPYWGNFGNPSLISISGLSNVTSIGGDLVILLNDTLNSLTGLDNLDAGSIGNLLIWNNQYLATCEVQSICDYLASPNGSVNIFDNASGCNNSPEVANACGNALPCLPYGNYYFLSQSDIDNFQSNYPGCTDLEGGVDIRGNDIINLNGLSAVNSIGNYLRIGLNTLGGGNPLLSELTGLEGLTSIGGDLGIYNNNALTSLTGLEGLTFIGGDLTIRLNDALNNLTGLDNIEAGSIMDLRIYVNDVLSECDIESICDYLASPNGTIEISSNASGCNSQEEVEDACDGVSIEELTLDEEFIISPNPSSGSMNLRYTIFEQGLTIIELFGISGEKIKSLVDEPNMPGTYEVEIDLSDLSKGFYFCVLKTNPPAGGQTTKIIKL